MKSTAAGFSKERVSELFNVLERIVEDKVNAIRMCMHNVIKTALKTFCKITGKIIREMKRSRLGQFEVGREEAIQKQLSDVSALLAAVHLLW
jgi:N-acetyl-beta-hexosaminidase